MLMDHLTLRNRSATERRLVTQNMCLRYSFSLESVSVCRSTNEAVLLCSRRSYSRDDSEASIDLHLDSFVDAFIFELLKAVLGILLLLDSMSLVQKLLGPK